MMDVGGETVAAAGGSTDLPAIIAVAVIWVAFFSWMAVVGWAVQRRKEREAYYRHETEKRLVDKGEVSAEQLLGLRSAEERTGWLRRREGLKLGGLITFAAGIGIVVSLRFIDTGQLSLGPLGWIPLCVGFVLLLYAYLLYPKLTNLGSAASLSPSSEREGGRRD